LPKKKASLFYLQRRRIKMRIKFEPQLYLEFPLESRRKIVEEYQAKYQAISEVLLENPQILDRAHRDFKKLSTRDDQASTDRNRAGSYTSEIILRSLIVHCLEQTSYRETTIRIANSQLLRQFVRLGPRDVPDYTFLCKAFNALSPQALEDINDALAAYAVEKEFIDPSAVRTDTTVIETNIHYPTDASLLWDCARVLIRHLRVGRDLAPKKCNHRFHDRKIKKLHVAIARASGSAVKGRKAKVSKRKRKKYFRKLIAHVQRLVDVAEPFVRFALKSNDIELRAVGYALEAILPDVRKVIRQSIRAQIEGETVPARERIFSIFEPHTELIKRGKHRTPVEFGHKIVIVETEETFITDYEILQNCPSDNHLTETMLERHKALFGEYPEVIAADTGFCPNKEKYEELEKKVDVLAIPRLVADRMNEEIAPWYRFRAGVEGTISVLKRAFRLFRCLYRGFKRFTANVGLGIFCHNLVLLARLRL
jgi:IS5 family transposase